MKYMHKTLLLIDSIVNIILGVLLLLFPIGVVDFLGLPSTNTNFYPSLLGAVILGIGFALLLELIGFARQVRGLGLGGAIVINIVGSSVLLCWLIFGSLNIPLKGRIILWIIGLVVFSIGVAELLLKSWICSNTSE
jgi:hypothetical protein